VNEKTIVICNFPRFSSEIWLPTLWAQAKTYYEMFGQRKDEWQWHPCYIDCYSTEHIAEIQKELLQAKPDVFAISLYVWNFRLAHEIAAWVKKTFPRCIVVSGGPHQYLKHDMEWFKKHPYLDASHLSDCYGELFFKELLDLYDDGQVDWPQLTDTRYPTGRSRHMGYSKTSMSKIERKSFQFDWSAYTAQYLELKKFESHKQQHFPQSLLLSVLETTRGCPYGCTYCDWGGGIGTTVIQKSPHTVNKDIDALCNFDLTYLYLADANFGIFGQRDVDIIHYLVDQKKKTKAQFKVGYGGFAKTENRLNYIKQIVEADINNSLSNNKELKISLQTIDTEILNNIDRKNIDLDKQLEIFQPIALNTKLPLYVEIIMGLPGMTLDKFYHELGVFGQRSLSIQWFEWILLPEAPAYSKDYRDKWGIKTTIKSNGWSYPESHAHHEIVVGTKSYTEFDYLEMLLSSSLYNLFVQGGYYKNTIDYLLQHYDIDHGNFIKNIYQNFFMRECIEEKDQVLAQWKKILDDNTQDCTFNINGEKIYGGYYFIAQVFLNPKFEEALTDWIDINYNIQFDTQKKDINQYISIKRNKKMNIHDIISIFRLFQDTGKIMQGKKKLLGIFNINK